MPPFALSTILTGGLRGAGDTRWPLLFTFVGFLLVRIPLAYYLAWDEITLPLVGWTIAGVGLGCGGGLVRHADRLLCAQHPGRLAVRTRWLAADACLTVAGPTPIHRLWPTTHPRI